MPKTKKKSHTQKVNAKKCYDKTRKVKEKYSENREPNVMEEKLAAETLNDIQIINTRKEKHKHRMQIKRAEDVEYRQMERAQNKQIKSASRTNEEFTKQEREQNARRMAETRKKEDYKEREKKKNEERIADLRTQQEYKDQERENNVRRMTEIRKNEEYKERENKKNEERMSELRTLQEYKDQERGKNVRRMTEIRKNEEYKEREKKKNEERMSELRTLHEYKDKERENNVRRMTEIRKSEEYKKREKSKNKERIADLRTLQEYKDQEREKNEKRIKERRTNEEYKEREKRKNEERIADLRSHQDYKDQEQDKNRERISKKRKDDKYRTNENTSTSKRMRSIRTDPVYSKAERQINMQSMQALRADVSLRTEERERDRQARRVKRSCEILSHRDVIYNNLKRRENDPHAIELLACIESRKEVPSLFCTCCERMFFEKGLKKITREKVISLLSAKVEAPEAHIFYWVDSRILNNYDDHRQNYLCFTCHKYVSAGKIPKLSSSNGLKLSPVPECLEELNETEERLVSPFVAFIKILLLNCRASNPQVGAKGSVIYVPTDVNEMEQSLPRNINNMNMIAIPVEFKRRMEHATSYLKGLVRKEVIEAAGKYLQETELYKKYGIRFAENVGDVLDMDDDETKLNTIDNENYNNEPEDVLNVDEEFMNLLNEGDDECLLIDLNEIAAKNAVVVMAPGQNQKPVSPYSNPDIEYLCFPKIFGGQPRILTDKNITSNDIIKWEIRNYKNRVEPRRILHLSKKKLLNESYNSIKVAIRKKKNAKNVTVQQALQPDYIGGLLSFNNGLRFMDQMRCAPAYMEQKKKILNAFLRQVGIPAFFLTVSAVETNWPELIQALVEYSTCEKLSLYDALNLPYEERAKLVKQNPVFVAMYYDNKVKNIMNIITKETGGIFNTCTVTDSFRRREFQQRGSPHDHILLWVDNAPKLDPDNSNTFDPVVQFVDKHITCEFDEDNPFCMYLRHKHTPTCSKGKKNKTICRFNFPKFVMSRTTILEPLPKVERTAEVKSNLDKIKTLMEKFFLSKDRIVQSFDEVLEDLQMSEETYLTALRSSINKLTIFYKRRSCEVDINTYNRTILNLMESNVDLQFVVDEHAVASYIVDYVVKGDAGLTKGLKDLQHELDKGDRNLQDKLRCIMNKFLNGHVISTSEAVYHCLGTPVTKFSRSSIFINTARSDERVAFLKSTKQLQAMDPDSTDIVGKDILTHYSERKALDNVCLAEFAAYYFQTARKPKRDKNLDSDDEHDADTESYDPELKRRKEARIIRYVRYKYEQDPENFYREQLLLFFPWRNEEEEIESTNWSAKYNENKEMIEKNRDKIFKLSSDRLDDAIIAAEQHRKTAEEEEIEEFERNELPKDHEIDILVQVGIDRPKNNVPFVYTAPPKTPKPNMFDMLCKLNNRQREIVMHIYKCFTTKKLPIRIFISGSAGVGKSMVISNIFQLVTHVLEYSTTVLRDQNADSIKVLLCAFSGKAAFLIGGNTLHSAFALPLQENSKMSDLPMDVANNLRQQLMDCKLIIIDEISMVGSTIFSRIDTRLRQITGKNESFGGLSIITVGDFLQLPPVKDSTIFYPPKHSLIKTSVSPLWDEFYLYELTEVMRQKDDLSFIKALNNFSRGEMTDDDIKTIKSREVEDHQVPDEAIRLYYTNADVDKFNNKKISESTESEIECIAVDTITGKLKPNQKAAKMKMWRERPTKDCGGYPYIIRFKQGIKYMLTANLDVSDGLVNGATGVLEHICCNTGGDKPTIVFLSFDSSNVGRKIRQQYRNFMENNNINLKWTPIPRKAYNLTTHFQKDYQMIRDQFPIVPCEALTIHKSQGQTYNNVCIDFRKSGNLTRQLVYVALSRVTKLSGLYILGNFPGNMKSNHTIDACLNEMKRLKTERPLSLAYNNLLGTQGLKVAYLNIRSLRANKQHVLADPWYSRCDVLIFSETYLYENEKVEFTGFSLLYRSDDNQYPEYVKKHIAKGIICFVKNHLTATVLKSCTEFKADQNRNYYSHVDLVSLDVNGVLIISGYKSPKASLSDFKEAMLQFQFVKTCPTIVTGDFNFNLNDTSNVQVSEFNSFLNSLSLESKLPTTENTTILSSRLDVLFANVENISAGVYECYFSDHKPVFCIIPIEQKGLTSTVQNTTSANIESQEKSATVVSDSISCFSLSSENDSVNSKDRSISSLSFQYSEIDSDSGYFRLDTHVTDWVDAISTSSNAYDLVSRKIFENIQQIFYNNRYTFVNPEELTLASTDRDIMCHKRSVDHIARYLKASPVNMYNCHRDTLFSIQELIGFKEIAITGDGNCQFNAISYALRGDESFSFDLRAIAFQTVLENLPIFEKIRTTIGLESISIFELLQICCTDAKYGNLDTLFALSMTLERIIYIMQQLNETKVFLKIVPLKFNNTLPSIVLRLRNPGRQDAHFNVLLPQNENTSYDFHCYDVYDLNRILMI